tara:strand:- start:497 stop:667 length:171 start_codon:yes stop_codon:yes gene_type:complete
LLRNSSGAVWADDLILCLDANSEVNADNLAYQQGDVLIVSNLQAMTSLLSPPNSVN